MPVRVLTVLIALALPAAAEAADLSGTYTGSHGNGIVVTHSGSSLNWVGTSGSGQWVHDYKGTLSGKNFTGRFVDRPGYAGKATGTINGHVVDDCHLKVDYVSIDGGPKNTENTELFSKTGCSGGASPVTPVPIASVSNGCGGEGWDVIVSAQNYVADTGTYKNGRYGRSYRVNFRAACNLHDAGYGGAVVKDQLHKGKVYDFRTWTRAAVDEKFLFDMRLLCHRAIPAEAKRALRDCRNIGAMLRYEFVRTVGHLFFDADILKAGTQKRGPRANS